MPWSNINASHWACISGILLAGCTLPSGRSSIPPQQSLNDVPALPINPTAAQFNIQYPAAYFSTLFEGNLRKSEFETQASYDARLDALASENRKAFVRVQADLVAYTYDAEKQVLLVSLKGERKFSSHGNFDFLIERSETNHGRVPMSNAFGVIVEVARESRKDYIFSISNYRDVPMQNDNSYAFITTGIKMLVPSDEARRLVQSRALTLVFEVFLDDLDGAYHNEGGRAPTVTNPVALRTDIYSLPVNLASMTVFDQNSGLIFATWKRP